ncbi:hypothetical protein PIB30_078982 [Stylosanthes scabra]|uniref:Uncharacterized protein n=1 Tax=Stylosanthes scabra TaxID=79078 RepID=A0ABU6YPU0_9FABA|nr:hypothetical protein [Stylosanthes scabra]
MEKVAMKEVAVVAEVEEVVVEMTTATSQILMTSQTLTMTLAVKAVTMTIISIHHGPTDVHLNAIKSGLRSGKFQETIAVNKPKTLAEFREKAQGQMEIEELRQQGTWNNPTTAKMTTGQTDNAQMATIEIPKKIFNQPLGLKSTHNSTPRKRTSSKKS